MPPRRCFPRGSSEAAFCGVFQRRRCAQRRRSLLSFSPPPPGERMPRARSRPCEPAGSPYPFPHFPARPSHASSFTLPPGQRYRARSPKQCLPKGSSEAAFCGIFQRRRCAQRRRSLLSFSPPPPGRTSFFTQPSCQRYRAPLFLHPFVPLGGRDSAAFFAACTGGGVVRSLFALSAARPALHLFFCTPPPATGCRARSPHPSRPPRQPLFPFPCFRATGAPMRTGGQSLLFPLFSARIPRFRAAATHGSFPLLLRAAAPVRGCSRRISPSISAPLCLPRSPLLCARPFRAGFFGSAPPCSPPPRAVSGPVPARADASRRSFAFPHTRRAPFLPCAPCAPGLCASRRGGESCKASCCALLHARPCSCAGGRIAPFFRLSPRAPRLSCPAPPVRPALFLRGRTHRAVFSLFHTRAARLSFPALPARPACAHRVEAGEAVKPAAARSCTPGPVPARADALRRSFAFSLARPACAPAAHTLCARPVRIALRRGKL